MNLPVILGGRDVSAPSLATTDPTAGTRSRHDNTGRGNEGGSAPSPSSPVQYPVAATPVHMTPYGHGCVDGVGMFRVTTGSGAVTWTDGLCRVLGIDRSSTRPSLEAIAAPLHADDRRRFLA